MNKLLALILMFLLTGCTAETTTPSNSNTNIPETTTSTSEEVIETTTETVEDNFNNEDNSSETIEFTSDFTDFAVLHNALNVPASSIDITDAIIEVNDNIPMFDNITTEVFEDYSDLDELGRCGVAFANICTELQPTEKRGTIGNVRPSGWDYNGKSNNHNYKEQNDANLCNVDGNYIYNRCHLIGYQLAGENANEKNLITGTRYLNVTGMLPYENMVDDYMDANPENHVLYRVTPSYIENDLVAQGVLMEAYSVEDNGTLQFCVWCPNVQPYIEINYTTGENHLASMVDNDNTNIENDIIEVDAYFVLNNNSMKIHKSTCSSVSSMKPEYREETDETFDELIDRGYTACGKCKPE